MGRGRTTTGTVIACLVKLRIDYGRPIKILGDVTREESDGGFSSGDEATGYVTVLTSNTSQIETDEKQNRVFGINDILLLWKITTLFDNGVECREALDAIIDRCSALQNIRQAVLQYRKVFNQQHVEPRVRRVALNRGAEYLERYFRLIAFAAYLGSEAFDGFCGQGESKMTFKVWLHQRPEVQAMKRSIRLRPGRFFTIPEELREPQESQHGDAVMEAIVKARNGSVLGKGSILKMYFFPGQRTSSHIQIHGAPHVYKVDEYPVYCMATPTISGAKEMLSYLDAKPKPAFTAQKVILTDLREEAIALQSPILAGPEADPKNVASIILGGGAGTRLFPLTQRRAKPAVPIGGCYRLVDIPMSNCINSGINKIYVLTQFNSQSLNRHIARAYNFGNGINFGGGFVEVLAAAQTPGESGKKWFQGTADAVRQFLWLFEDAEHKNIENILILCGDQLYRMDYMELVQKHINSCADISVSCLPVDGSRASDFGLVKVDESGQIRQFLEKPKGELLRSMHVDTSVFGLSAQEARKFPYIASMGIYVFKIDVLLKLLRDCYPNANDFGSEVIPMAAKDFNVQACLFSGYWEDIGTIKSFFDANLALTDKPPKFQMYDQSKPLFTCPRFLPPTKMEECQVINSLISDGCFLRKCIVEHSIVGIRSRLDSGVHLKDTMMMGADYYQTEPEIAALLAAGNVPIGIGKDTKIVNCIIDKNARIGNNVIIANKENVQEADRPSEGFYIRSGITVVLKDSVISNGTII
ncbi:glucose-1-phosphate adenylyltransferase large subunit 2, chloroplastic-like [Gastrolobium bilobum]|uniref:glucose-1-phosphate adenylyltransferase large subunit 2, chloroplastic-like n=1 Tax=Gastrolobium bilobum TaxID=150636 RepID=UPI002AB03F7E|nr:glucose-1-phosphate adenylyltransferase large subunit 2, chloroplastic-like [Gastrolobium bilobum]